jgi:hypothetical protein
MIADCSKGYAFLAAMTEDERALAVNPHQRRRNLHATLGASCLRLAQAG